MNKPKITAQSGFLDYFPSPIFATINQWSPQIHQIMEKKYKADEVRKKGRPRTNTDSQQVLERRRKQLRMAQQMYRKRKEDTIGNLQYRVQELESGIEQLSQSFLAFSDLLLETDLLGQYSHVASALHTITQQYVSLARAADEEPLAKAAGVTPAIVNRDEGWNNTYSSVPSIEVDSTMLSSTPIELPNLPLLFTQPPSYQGRATQPMGVAMAPPAIEYSIVPSPLHSHSPTISLTHSVKEERWTFSQNLVKACCQNGYQLLVNTPNDVVKIQGVFGSSVPPKERSSLISCFQAGMKDETGDLIDLMAHIPAPLRSKRKYCAPDEPANLPKSWELTVASEPGEWLDASGVQKVLSERGFSIQENGSSFSSSRLMSSLHVATFVQLLAAECICFGIGPAFRRQNVEAALRLASNHE